MNDRMTELYASACLYAREKQLDRKSEDKDVGEFVKCMSEKFAELIVKEAGTLLMSPEFIGRSDLDWSMVLNEHFGVEE